jgi:hypothetical protein
MKYYVSDFIGRYDENGQFQCDGETSRVEFESLSEAVECYKDSCKRVTGEWIYNANVLGRARLDRCQTVFQVALSCENDFEREYGQEGLFEYGPLEFEFDCREGFIEYDEESALYNITDTYVAVLHLTREERDKWFAF